MLFVDGENITIRGQALAKSRGVVLERGDYYEPDVFLWLHEPIHATRVLSRHLRGLRLREAAERAFYYTSMTGSDEEVESVQDKLWKLGFTAEVFRKHRKGVKAKGVDIALTKDLLSNAFMDNYDVAVVITGDADYRPVISELKRLGKTVCLMAVTEGSANVNTELKRSADSFFPIDNALMNFWPRPEAADSKASIS